VSSHLRSFPHIFSSQTSFSPLSKSCLSRVFAFAASITSLARQQASTRYFSPEKASFLLTFRLRAPQLHHSFAMPPHIPQERKSSSPHRNNRPIHSSAPSPCFADTTQDCKLPSRLLRHPHPLQQGHFSQKRTHKTRMSLERTNKVRISLGPHSIVRNSKANTSTTAYTPGSTSKSC
jgi:hypothetical protein